MDVLKLLAVIFLLAFLVESLVEYLFGQLIAHLPVFQPYGWVLVYISAAVGVVCALFYGFDLLYLLGNWLEVSWSKLAEPSIIGMVMTGLAIGRGANYLHDLVSKFFVKPEGAR